jgi:hypothetical protein
MGRLFVVSEKAAIELQAFFLRIGCPSFDLTARLPSLHGKLHLPRTWLNPWPLLLPTNGNCDHALPRWKERVIRIECRPPRPLPL